MSRTSRSAPGPATTVLPVPIPQVLLASCAALPRSDGDDDGLVPALAQIGIRAGWAPWDDPGTDFAAADLVVLRSTWDYTSRREKFLAWCASVPRLVNPAPVARWNTDKSYLLDLAGAGVPVVPTRLLPPGTPLLAEVPDDADGIVLKPAVGAGARGAGIFRDREVAAEHLAALHAAGHTGVLQPFQPSVASVGETAMVYIGGAYSHAFSKGSLLGGSAVVDVDASGLFGTERLGAAEPTPVQHSVAEAALDAATRLLGLAGTALLYARVDLVEGSDGDPLLLECELTEPSLGFAHADTGAPLRFASAVRARIAVSGQ